MSSQQTLITTHSVETPSGRISYASAGFGPVALFVHGVVLNKHLWRHQLAGLSDIRRCYEFRVVTEAGAAALAARQADESDIAAIQSAWDELERVIETQGIGAKDDFAFHLAIARASHNQFFITVMSFIEEQVVFSMNLSRNLSLVKTLERQRLVQAEHLEVLEAIRAHDADRAGRAMAAHLQNALDRMFGS